MANLTGSAPRGLKGEKQPKAPRKAVRKVSAKRAAYLASADRQDGLDHMARVKGLSCICCGHPPPSAAHHVTGDGMPRNDMRVLPLCYECHQGQNGYHNSKAAWVAKYGPDFGLLEIVESLLKAS